MLYHTGLLLLSSIHLPSVCIVFSRVMVILAVFTDKLPPFARTLDDGRSLQQFWYHSLLLFSCLIYLIYQSIHVNRAFISSLKSLKEVNHFRGRMSLSIVHLNWDVQLHVNGRQTRPTSISVDGVVIWKVTPVAQMHKCTYHTTKQHTKTPSHMTQSQLNFDCITEY